MGPLRSTRWSRLGAPVATSVHHPSQPSGGWPGGRYASPVPAMSTGELQQFLLGAFPDAPSTMVVERRADWGVRLRLPVTKAHGRRGGTVSGPALMGLADGAAWPAALFDMVAEAGSSSSAGRWASWPCPGAPAPGGGRGGRGRRRAGVWGRQARGWGRPLPLAPGDVPCGGMTDHRHGPRGGPRCRHASRRSWLVRFGNRVERVP